MSQPDVLRAVIGGTGFSERAADYSTIETDYGDVRVGSMELGGREVLFVPRHAALEVPHLVNYRANIQALKLKGVNTIYAVSAAGRLHESVLPGHLVSVSDLDWDDAHRDSTFAEKGLLLHASMHEPMSKALGNYLTQGWGLAEAKVAEIYADSPDLSVGYHADGTYFNIQGPAFSPPAREARLRNTVHNARLIGQTLHPEAGLAREMGMAYAAVGMCVDHSNYPDAPPVTHADGVMHAVVGTAQAAVALLDEAMRFVPDDFQDMAHDAFSHSIHPSQVDFGTLRANGRTKLALIIENALET